MITDGVAKIPPFRKLRGYAFDPSLSLKIDTVFINDLVYKVIWEEDIKAGPVGEYLEVIDFDPTVKKFYEPVNLNDVYILAQDGLEPSESNPQFHQQMVYAVAMTTIKNFESALGRPIMWAHHRLSSKKFKEVLKLRIYPHAFRDANAYYSSQKKALLFGYFNAQPADATVMMPEHQVFTCLSHDIIAHETTHAILDGIYNRYIEDTNLDTLAFHEAFADIVALFQHFTFPDVLKHQVAKTRGDLSSQNLLGQLAQEFGSAIGNYGALRDAIGSIDPETKKWKLKEPDGNEYLTITEEHDRGSILVAAVFEAFLTIYKTRISDLLRIASNGTGILQEGELHPDLVNRLAGEASKVAGHVLKMCIRALDYCPPLDINFGDYLRAIITADNDLMPDDNRNYRLAFIDSFRRRGIYPNGIKSLSVESLCYPVCKDFKNDTVIPVLIDFFRDFGKAISYSKNRDEITLITKEFITGKKYSTVVNGRLLGLFDRLMLKFDNSDEFQRLTGLVFNRNWKAFGVGTTMALENKVPSPSYAVHSLKYAARVGPLENKSNQVVVSLTQHAQIEVKEVNGEKKMTKLNYNPKFKEDENHFEMYGGATLIFDLDTQKLKYVISKPLINTTSLMGLDEERALQIHRYYQESRQYMNHYKANFGLARQFRNMEPFNFLHTH